MRSEGGAQASHAAGEEVTKDEEASSFMVASVSDGRGLRERKSIFLYA